MFVKGSPTAARELSADLVSQIKAIRSAIDGINQDLKALGGTYQDEGFGEMQQTVKSVADAAIAAMEPISSVCKSLHRYAEILENS